MQNQRGFSSSSMIAPIVGLYNLKIRGLVSVNLVVMKNTTLAIREGGQMLYKFDLKGSLMKRNTFPLLKYLKATSSMFEQTGTVMKDVDFLFLHRCKPFLDLGLSQGSLLLAQIKRDTQFLASLNIMDYSLLLAVEPTGEENETNFRDLFIMDLKGKELRSHSFTYREN